jgi:hypothetical protein
MWRNKVLKSSCCLMRTDCIVRWGLGKGLVLGLSRKALGIRKPEKPDRRMQKMKNLRTP